MTRLSALACPLLLALSLDAAAQNLYTTVNQLRTRADCAPAQRQPALVPQPALERAARDLSRGGDLKESLKDAGYRAKRSRAISVRGEDIPANVAPILAKNYCRDLQEPGMTDAGIHVEAGQFWLVMASRLTVEMPPEAAGQRVLELVNQARTKPRTCGRQQFKAAKPVRWNDTLALAARRHAEDMASHNYFAHGGRDGSTPARRVERAGYRYRITGENIAAGPTTPDDAVAGWINSPRHCANLMNPQFTEMGAAYAVDPSSEMGVYWAQVFGTPR